MVKPRTAGDTNMKRYFALFSIVALALALAAPIAFAGRGGHHDRNGVEVEIENRAAIFTGGFTIANTGLNDANGNRGAGRITTGVADADALLSTEANTSDVRVQTPSRCGRCSNGGVEVEIENGAFVGTLGVTVANTGLNDANGNGGMMRGHHGHHHGPRSVGRGVIVAGDATAVSTAMTLVNSSVVRVGR